MKKGLLLLGLALTLGASQSVAYADAPTVNLTPKPKEITVKDGNLTLPASFSVKADGLNDEMKAEITKFAEALKAATGIEVGSGQELMTVTVDNTIATEGYTLDVTADGIAIKASAPAGLFYAFQTIKKVLPPNVAVGVRLDGEYSLPYMSLNDEPRYHWRGIEIDVARHFFDVKEIKKMLDIMAVYKMNRLHWHLTDDQGWRIEMPKYPKLTTEAATAPNAYWWDFDNHVSYLTNEMYGPHYYTIDEMKDVVAYAKERHIEICPEVDLPGHMQCAIAAYPEFSTTPDGDHPVRYWPGVSTDILDVSNPAVVKFLKDLIDELVDIFPYEYIHIGGDECPTTAWANSASCQAFKKEKGLTSDRAIQSWLVKELADHAKKYDRRLIAWNEIITAEGADTKLAQDADILVYAWLNAGSANNPSKQAAELGLRSVWCSTNHYYIDYPQWGGNEEPKSMGFTITLQTVYNTKPDYDERKKEFYYGVNCNLWTEYISEPKHLEYNALPRMIAVAETGWTPDAKKDFEDFKLRFNADTKMLDLGNYNYGRHYVTAQDDIEKEMPEEGKWYRLITQASHDANRKDRCIELVHAGCSLISEKSATAGRLWTNTQAAEGSDHYDWQYWTFEPDPAGSGLFAMVNRKAPDGSVNPAMNGSSINARWDYDNNKKHYEFVLGDFYGTAALGHTYSIRSKRGGDWYLNCAQVGANQTVNNWSAPDDGNGGIWLFALEGLDAQDIPSGVPFAPLKDGKYAFVNTIERGALAITDGELATEPDPACGAIAWEVTAGDYNNITNTQTLTLRNTATGKYLAGLSSTAISTTAGIGFQDVYADNGGYDVLLTADASAAAKVELSRDTKTDDTYFLTLNGKRLFAFGPKSIIEVNGVNARENSPASQGAAWTISGVTKSVKVTVVEGEDVVGTFYHYDLEGKTADKLTLPATAEFEDFEYVSETAGEPADGHDTATVTVKRKTRTATYVCRDENGVIWEVVNVKVPADGTYNPVAPEFPYMTFVKFAEPESELKFNAIYKTEAYMGIAEVSEPVTELKEGVVYAIRDTHSTRNAYRCATAGGLVNGAKSGTGLSPMFTWTLEATSNNRYFVKNVATETYVQELGRSVAATLGDKGYGFLFTWDTDHWNIKGSNGMYWDGEESLNLVGWDGGTGHPYQIYTVAQADPFFKVVINEVSTDGNVLSTRSVFVKAGESYMFAAATHAGMSIVDVKGHEGFDEIYSNKTVTVTYEIEEQDGIDELHSNQTPGVEGIYDLSGRRLNKISRPGIYIVNGVKTLVK